MTTPDDRSDAPTPRREFLGQVAVTAIALAGAGCAKPVAVASAATPAGAPAAAASGGKWDDSWFGRITAKHKAVFDSMDIDDGRVLSNATSYVRGMREALGAGPNDVQAVVVVRHSAIAMALNDAMWAKYEIGKDKKIKAPRSEDWVTRNPYMGSAANAGRGGGPGDGIQSNFTWLASNGHILLGCDLATRNYANTVARAQKLEGTAVYEDFKANLIPGMILQPTGVYAALRAQEAGCAYLRSV